MASELPSCSLLLQALPTQRLVVQGTAPGGKGGQVGQVSLTVHGTQQVHSPPEVGGGPAGRPPHSSPQVSVGLLPPEPTCPSKVLIDPRGWL